MMGLLYKRGKAKVDLLDDLLASRVLIAWSKTALLYYGYRAKENSPDWAEWFEYLAVALDKRFTALGEPHNRFEAHDPGRGFRRRRRRAGGTSQPHRLSDDLCHLARDVGCDHPDGRRMY